MRRHSLKKLWVVVVLLLVGNWHLDAPGATVLQVDGGAPEPDCEEWNTPEFFETATVEDLNRVSGGRGQRGGARPFLGGRRSAGCLREQAPAGA